MKCSCPQAETTDRCKHVIAVLCWLLSNADVQLLWLREGKDLNKVLLLLALFYAWTHHPHIVTCSAVESIPSGSDNGDSAITRQQFHLNYRYNTEYFES